MLEQIMLIAPLNSMRALKVARDGRMDVHLQSSHFHTLQSPGGQGTGRPSAGPNSTQTITVTGDWQWPNEQIGPTAANQERRMGDDWACVVVFGSKYSYSRKR